MRLSAYDTFCLYLALKNHFTRDSYDFFKYHGKTGVNKETFMNRKDKHQFAKLSRIYDDTEMKDFMIANFIHDDKMWVGSLLEDEAKDRYIQYKKRKESLTYTFGNELDNLIAMVNGDIKSLFRPTAAGQLPLLSGYYEQRASLETLTILDYFVDYFNKYEDRYKDDYLWSKLRIKCKKLLPFMSFDQKKLANTMKERMNAHIYS